MGADRLTGLALLHVHRDTMVDIEEIIDNFSVAHPRRMKLVNILEDSQDMYTKDYQLTFIIISHCIICDAAYFGVKLYSEYISVHQIFKIFLGGMPPDPLASLCYAHLRKP